MTDSGDDDDQVLADFLEAEILSVPDQDEKPLKRPRIEEGSSKQPSRIESGIFGKVPPELFHHILKFLSSEDLIACSLVCRFMNFAASDERLWRRLYCLRWGMASPTGKPRECAWKKLYIQRDQDDMVEFVRNTPPEFKDYYIQMQAAKRSQAPLPSQVSDDRVILDKTVGDQVSIWKRNRGFTDEAVTGHVCSGHTCSYTQIGDVFLCEKTGCVHVCDDTCREVVLDQYSGLLVCTVSGQCFDRWIAFAEESDTSCSQQSLGRLFFHISGIFHRCHPILIITAIMGHPIDFTGSLSRPLYQRYSRKVGASTERRLVLRSVRELRHALQIQSLASTCSSHGISCSSHHATTYCYSQISGINPSGKGNVTSEGKQPPST